MYSYLRYVYMRLVVAILTLTLVVLISESFTFQGGPKPKKVYKDTIYRYKTKTKAEPVTVAQKPATVPAKPVQPAIPSVPKTPQIAEEDRIISITAEIKKFVVKKSQNKLYVYFGDTFKVFRISLGANPTGHKMKQGDNKTPEGKYTISFKNPKSRGYRSLKISYPNDADRENARRAGYDPGGDIFIHGLWWNNQDPKNHWKDNWTRGCIAVNNSEIEEIYNHTSLNTEINIQP